MNDPTSGHIYFGGKDVTKVAPEDREIGLVFQNYALYPHMTVADNIMFPLINRKIPKAEARERAQEMAKLVQLDHLMDRKPKALSGGQQQRVAIARALVKKPEVLLLGIWRGNPRPFNDRDESAACFYHAINLPKA